MATKSPSEASQGGEPKDREPCLGGRAELEAQELGSMRELWLWEPAMLGSLMLGAQTQSPERGGTGGLGSRA